MTRLFNLNISFLRDPLSLFFVFTILLISLPSAVYSVGYLKGQTARKIFYGWSMFLVFVASMLCVVTVNNAFAFLIAWEIMSLVSYFLVIFDNRSERAVNAGIIYLVMTHVGTAFIIAAFLIMYAHAGSFNFSILRAACQTFPPHTKNLLFLFLLIGFGTKAGIVPLHIWLPYAHPQAPSHISSLMSGVMIKTAIYGIVRFIIFILGVNAFWWGNLVLILAVFSCLIGVIYALMEHDLKKLLAYHSVENIGIILLGVGASMVFLKLNMPLLSVFALAAGLYHLINHAIFKGLLFLCAGSVYNATGTRDMEKLGGLIKKMPVTAFCFLLGAMAISALPPLNGFVSEWLTLQAFFAGLLNATGGFKIFFALCAAALALTGGLAAACFVKAFGITFLAMPRSIKAQEVRETAFSMKAGMIFLSVLTVVFGLAAAPIFKIIAAVAQSVISSEIPVMDSSLHDFMLGPSGNVLSLSMPLVTIVLLAIMAIAALLVFALSCGRTVKKCGTWDCGYYALTSRNEYTATAFSKPFRIAFSFFLLPYRKTEKIRESFYHVRHFKYETHTTPVFKKYVYIPIVTLILTIARFMRKIQPGSIHLYIAYIFATIVTLIVFMKVF
ncbi:MAG: proton-conducting transporter membrane subunit [Candidatus Omnitrophica bacterium]|nr:proton-conducting transporter membrane subunit [Candidatus Omnitrophota bacterium]